MRAQRERPVQWFIALWRKNVPSRTHMMLPHQHPKSQSPRGSGMLPTFSYTRARLDSFSNSSIVGSCSIKQPPLMNHFLAYWQWRSRHFVYSFFIVLSSAYTQADMHPLCWYLWLSLVSRALPCQSILTPALVVVLLGRCDSFFMPEQLKSSLSKWN